MSDPVKIVSIGSVAIVATLSFLLLPGSTAIHNTLVYGLLVLTGVYTVGAGVSWVARRLKIEKDE